MALTLRLPASALHAALMGVNAVCSRLLLSVELTTWQARSTAKKSNHNPTPPTV